MLFWDVMSGIMGEMEWRAKDRVEMGEVHSTVGVIYKKSNIFF